MAVTKGWKSFLHTILLIAAPVVSMAQTDTLPQENWDSYLAQYDKNAGSIILNMSLKKVAPLAAYPFVVITGVTYSDCTGDGFPSKREFTNLYKISDSAKAVIDRTNSNISAGSFTFQCQRLDYYYVKDTAFIRQRLANMYKARFPDYQPYINIRKDGGWLAYLDFLYPNEETLDYMGNQKVLLALQNAGDKLVKARPVEHFAYFKTEADRTCYIAFLIKNKFTITAKEPSDVAGFPLGLLFSRTDKIDLPSISKITLELRRQATICHGDYDGWETVVIK